MDEKGRWLAVAGLDKRIRVFDATNGELLQEFLGHEAEISALRFAEDETRLFSASEDGTVHVWDPRSSATQVLGSGVYFVSATYSPDGDLVAAGSGGVAHAGRQLHAPVWVWQVEAAELRFVRGSETGGEAESIAFRPGGGQLVAGYNSGVAALWDVHRGVLIRSFPDDPSQVAPGAIRVAFSPDGETLGVTGDDGVIRLWEVSSASLRQELTGHEGFVSDLSFHPDGTKLASASADGTLRIWELSTGRSEVLEIGKRTAVWTVAYDAEGGRIASGDERDVRIWNSATGELLRVLRGHEAEVTKVAWAPDGTRIVSASYDRTVRLWEPQTGAPLIAFREGVFQWVEFSSDGASLLAAGEGGVRIWKTTSSSTLMRGQMPSSLEYLHDWGRSRAHAHCYCAFRRRGDTAKAAAKALVGQPRDRPRRVDPTQEGRFATQAKRPVRLQNRYGSQVFCEGSNGIPLDAMWLALSTPLATPVIRK